MPTTPVKNTEAKIPSAPAKSLLSHFGLPFSPLSAPSLRPSELAVHREMPVFITPMPSSLPAAMQYPTPTATLAPSSPPAAPATLDAVDSIFEYRQPQGRCLTAAQATGKARGLATQIQVLRETCNYLERRRRHYLKLSRHVN